MMDFDLNALECVISNETLNNLIQNATSSMSLLNFLKIKHHRISNGTSQKLSFITIVPELIWHNCDILRYIFLTSANIDDILAELCEFVEKILYAKSSEYEVSQVFKLLHIVYDYHVSNNLQLFWSLNTAILHKRIVNELGKDEKNIRNLLIYVFLPTYLKICLQSQLLQDLFNLVRERKQLEIFCVLFDHFSVNNFAAIDIEEYWVLLADCLTYTGQVHKQAVYLLRKSVEDTLPWQSYFILLNVVNEKQLHLVEPSLKLLDSITELLFLWRKSLYRNFLLHSQNDVVYAVAAFILHQSNWNEFIEILPDLLKGVNKHEYSIHSQNFYKLFTEFTQRLNDTQIEFVLKECFKITWTPVALWSVFNSIFSKEAHFMLCTSLAVRTLQKIKEIPHIYCRQACFHLILNYVSTICTFETLKDISNVLKDLDTNAFDYVTKITNLRDKKSHINQDLEIKDKPTDNLESIDLSYNILENCERYNNSQIDSALKLIIKNELNIDRLTTFYRQWSETQTIFVIIAFPLMKANICLDRNIIASNITGILDSDNRYKEFILENIDLLMLYEFDNQLIEHSLNNICALYQTSNFQNILANLLPKIFNFNKYYQTLQNFGNNIMKFSKNNNILAYLMAEKGISVLRSCDEVLVLIPILIELILFGTPVNKNEIVKFYVYQEIQTRLDFTDDNPNLSDIYSRLYALDTILRLICESKIELREKIISEFVNGLLMKYKINMNKRYFPDSQIHLEKLRILQALVLVHCYITEKTSIINLLIEDILLEHHLPSVKHLSQWFLILLLENTNYLELIIKRVKSLDPKSPILLNFIPILYYLVKKSDQLEKIIDCLLPWTMGPQFKLRLFCQITLWKLLTKFNGSFQKYEYLQNSLKEVVHDTISNDLDDFLDYFPITKCDLYTVYYTIPKKTKVGSMEWQNLIRINPHKFKYLKMGTIFDEELLNQLIIQDTCPEIDSSRNIQKKIIPLNDFLTDSTSSANDFILVTSLVEKSTNLGGLSRTCEVFGIKRLVMRTQNVTFDKEFKSLSMSSENWINITEVKIDDLTKFILKIKNQGYCVVGSEQTAESMKLDQYKFSQRTCLILGNEKEGIPPTLIGLMDHCVEIPQLGVVRSLNVHVAGAIMIWEYTKQYSLKSSFN